MNGTTSSRWHASLIPLFLLRCFAIALTLWVAGHSAHAQFNEDAIREAFASDIAAVQANFRFTSVNPNASTLAGDPSCQARLESIEERLKRIGCVNVRRQPFLVTRPIAELGAKTPVKTRDGNFDSLLHPLWPNLVDCTNIEFDAIARPTQFGLTAAMQPRHLKPAIVHMSGNNHPSRGFADPRASGEVLGAMTPSNRFVLESFLHDVPVRAPRIYLPGLTEWHSDRLQTQIRFAYRVQWKQVETFNIIADLPGTDPKLANEPILLGTYADGFSIAFTAAPGGTAMANVDALIAILEQLKRNPAPRPIRVVIFSGHAFGLKGERVFVESMLNNPNERIRIGAMLDLSGRSRTIGIFGQGALFGTRPESRDIVRRPAAVWRMWANAVAPLVGMSDPRVLVYDGINESDGQPWQACHMGPFAASSEPFLLANLPVVTFRTTNDARPQVGTPFDWLGSRESESIAFQAGVVCALLRLPLHQPSRENFDGIPPFPADPVAPRQASLVAAFSAIEGRALRFNPQKSFLPNEPVPGALAVVRTPHKILCGVLGDLVEMADMQGTFKFIGLPGVQSYWHTDRRETRIMAFQLNESGTVVATATSSQNTGPPFPRGLFLDRPVRSTTLTLFDVKAIVAPFVADPLTWKPLQDARIIDPTTGAEPRNFEVVAPPPGRALSGESWNSVVVFHDASGSVDLEMRGTGSELRKVWRGINAADYQLLKERHAAQSALEEMKSQEAKFAPYGMLPPEVRRLIQSSEGVLTEVGPPNPSEDTGEPRQDRVAILAQQWLGKIRPFLAGQSREMVLGLLLYLGLLIPFAWAFERLVFGFKFATHRLLGLLAVFVAGYWVLLATHPAFQVVNNPFVIFLAFAMAALSLWVIGVVFQRFDRSFRRLGPEAAGVRGGWTVAVGLATENLRRRRLRSALMVGQLAVASYVLLSFTSLASVYVESSAPQSVVGPSAFVNFVRDPSAEPLPNEWVLNETSWKQTGFIYPDPKRQLGRFEITEGLRTHEARALSVIRDDDSTRSGIWVPESWKVETNEVWIHGWRFEVLGVLRDPDQKIRNRKVLAPLDFGPAAMGSQSQSAGWKSVPSMPIGQYAVIELGKNAEWPVNYFYQSLDSLGQDFRGRQSLTFSTDLPVIRSDTGGATITTGSFGARPEGLGFALLPFLMAVGFVWIASAASAMERKSEIATFSALGMAPKQLVQLFVAEAAILGIIGAMLGYGIAQVAARIAAQMPGMEFLTLNFGSGSAALSTALTLLIALLGSAYPMWTTLRQSHATESKAQLEAISESHYRYTFPAAIASHEVEPLTTYLQNLWIQSSAASAGVVLVEHVQRTQNGVTCSVSVAPYDLGVVYQVELDFEPTQDPAIVRPRADLTVISGDLSNGRRLAVRVLDTLRQQMLAWRLNRP